MSDEAYITPSDQRVYMRSSNGRTRPVRSQGEATITLSLPIDLKVAVKKAADSSDRNVSQIIRRAIRRAIEANEL